VSNGSPRGTHLRNGFGESGFETTLGVTNRVALLPSGQSVGSRFQRPDSDSQHTGPELPDWMETLGRARDGSPSETNVPEYPRRYGSFECLVSVTAGDSQLTILVDA
jgi:hypothetical protein